MAFGCGGPILMFDCGRTRSVRVFCAIGLPGAKLVSLGLRLEARTEGFGRPADSHCIFTPLIKTLALSVDSAAGCCEGVDPNGNLSNKTRSRFF